MEYPSHCQTCGLFKNCQSWNIRGRGSLPAEILVVGQGPGYHEDKRAEIFVGPSGEFLQSFLDRLDVTWRLCNATNCFPGRKPNGEQGDMKPTKEQIEACSVYLQDEITKAKPKVIICLGDTALRAILGSKAPRTLTEAKRRTYDVGGIKVLSNYHPVNHVTGRQNLVESYIAMFSYAERLCSNEVVQDDFEHRLITDEAEALRAVAKWPVRNTIWLDVETAVSGQNPNRKTIFHKDSKLLSISVTYLEGKTEYKTIVFAEAALSPTVIKEILSNRVVDGHNIKYDLVAIWALTGVNPFDYSPFLPHDTFLSFYQQDQSKIGNGLKPLANKFFFADDWEAKVWETVDERNEQIRKLNSLITQENKKLRRENKPLLSKHALDADFECVPISILAEYNGRDTYYTARLRNEILKEFPDTDCYKLSRRLTKALAYLEMQGLPCNYHKLQVVLKAVDNKKRAILDTLLQMPEVKAVCETGYIHDGIPVPPTPFNEKSYLFMESLAKRIGGHNGEVSASGKRLSFNKVNMMQMAVIDKDDSPGVERTRTQWIWYYIYKYKQLRHMSEAFLSKMFMPYVVDGRLRTTYKMGKAEGGFRVAAGDVSGGAETGRLSSANPNLQNLKKDRILRSCFEAPPGWILMEFDYDRIEIVVLAYLSGDEALIKAVSEFDVHTETAKKIFKTDSPSDAQRSWAKTMVFAIIYGQLPSTYAAKNGCTIDEAEKLYDDFFKAYPKIREYFLSIEAKVRLGEMVVSVWGRLRSYPLYGDNRDWSTLNEAKNSGIQSTASDNTAWMLCEIIDELEANEIKNYKERTNLLTLKDLFPINVVHDSIWFQCKEERQDEAIQFIVDIMEDISRLPVKWDIPMRVSYTTGKSLADTM